MTDQTDKPVAIRCKANGCPLRWEVATYFHEPEKKGDKRIPRGGVCRFHRAARAEQWSATTRRIIEVYPYLRMLQAVRSISDARYKPGHNETVEQWSERMDRMINAHIEQDQHTAPPPDQSVQQLRQLVGLPAQQSPEAGK